jgi:hypothetical protein
MADDIGGDQAAVNDTTRGWGKSELSDPPLSQILLMSKDLCSPFLVLVCTTRL